MAEYETHPGESASYDNHYENANSEIERLETNSWDRANTGVEYPWNAGPGAAAPCTPQDPGGSCSPGYVCIGGYCMPWDLQHLETGYGPGGQITTNLPPVWQGPAAPTPMWAAKAKY
jgi:hypothetical protein